ncbi:hypothetical protein SERLA73DRAFT_45365, partial [Serpula lacrymans var. lacrymans S7.3]
KNLLSAPHNAHILNLLFDLVTWHAYAKLHLHTSDTLNLFDLATILLSQSMRKFIKVTCSYYDTKELPQETSIRNRCVAALASKQDTAPTRDGSSGSKQKKLNLTTYKYHALADYPNTIRQKGTTDNYNTQTVKSGY